MRNAFISDLAVIQLKFIRENFSSLFLSLRVATRQFFIFFLSLPHKNLKIAINNLQLAFLSLKYFKEITTTTIEYCTPTYRIIGKGVRYWIIAK